ncbi:hypothetical protein DFP72DRAFT_1172858 [Ephemerocybe angulata]|uniref:Transmembrane protein n=1 Tax=Ephemerocybe angulata TaxID=980116 RepID=A0A8H6HPV6_9AGAR|nr:hypothetical protein DFP72DRAFT_1172858 [Tulosesus angulatus]
MPSVDDSSSSVSYSGGWSLVSDSQQYQGSVHSSTSVGNTATIRFTGNSIKVYGTNPAGYAGGLIQATFIIDNQENSWTRTSHGSAYYQDFMWESGHLSDGTHTLVVRNAGTQVPLRLDYFDIEGTVAAPAMAAPQPSTSTSQAQSQPQTTKVITQTITNTASIQTTVTNTQSKTATTTTTSTTTTQTSTSSTSHTSLGQSTSSTGVVSQSLSVDRSGQTVTAFQVITTSVSGVATQVTIYPSGGGSLGATGAAASTISLGAIIGAVVGSLVFIVLLILFLVLCLRRRRRAVTLVQSSDDNEGSGGMRESPPQDPFRASVIPRLSESLRPGAASKYRSQQQNVRPFTRLTEVPDNENESTSTGSAPPSLAPLNFSSNEKGALGSTLAPVPPSSSGHSWAASLGTNLTSPSPIVSDMSTTYAESSVGEAPPAYHSGRASSLYPTGDISLAQAH